MNEHTHIYAVIHLKSFLLENVYCIILVILFQLKSTRYTFKPTLSLYEKKKTLLTVLSEEEKIFRKGGIVD